MPMKLLSADDFRSAAKDGAKPDGTVFRFATTEPQNVEGHDRTKRFVFSDATIDHAGDKIDPKGWDLGIFKRNPVALFSHMSWEPPIGRASNVSVQNDQLVGDIEFATAEVYEFADTIFRLVDGGFMNAVSVGFKPKDWAFTSDKDRPYGIDFKKQTLLEISVCPVPCNPNALGEARSMGIDTSSLTEWAEKVLDSGDTVFLPRKELETLRSQAGAMERKFYIQAPVSFTQQMAEHIRDSVKAWENDPSSVLIVPEGVTLRTIGEDQADNGASADQDDMIKTVAAALAEIELPASMSSEQTAELVKAVAGAIEKAGRRVSAATKAKLQEAMGHHEAMGACINSLMDDGDDDEPDGDADDVASDPTRASPQPPGTVVVESQDDLTPEERRIKEVRALRETIPTND